MKINHIDLLFQYVYIYERGVCMVKKLIQHGNSAALILDKPILDLLNFEMDTPLEISTDGKNLIISAQTIKNGEKDILRSLEKINKRYATALKKLGE
jgi:antitoxin component of MazEF toxin-antitoxin module